MAFSPVAAMKALEPSGGIRMPLAPRHPARVHPGLDAALPTPLDLEPITPPLSRCRTGEREDHLANLLRCRRPKLLRLRGPTHATGLLRSYERARSSREMRAYSAVQECACCANCGRDAADLPKLPDLEFGIALATRR